jgi:FkbM family methyltransferase
MFQLLSDCGLHLDSGVMVLPGWVRTVKIDVGLSSNAPQTELWLRSDSKTLVFGFEPVRSNLESLQSGSSNWPLKLDPKRIGKSVYLLPCALGSKSMVGPREMYVTDDDAGRSSLLSPVNFSVERMEKINVYTLSDFFSCFPFNVITTIDHLKIDVQGLDFEVLKGASRFLRKISVITVEVDQTDYKGTTNNFKEMRFFLALYGHLYIRHPHQWNYWFRKFRISILFDTHDPTFINVRHLLKFRRKSLHAIQLG